MNEPLVSIVIPVYNAERFLADTINSVKDQTYEHWEMILIDDCSDDNSRDIISKLKQDDNRIRYIKLDVNSGAAVSRNTGIKHAKGRFIAFLDSDDVWTPEKLDIQIDYMLKQEIGFTFTSYRFMKSDGELSEKVVKVPRKIDYEGLLRNTIIGCSTVVIDRHIIGDFEMPNVRKGQDTATWLKILKNEEYAYGIDKILVKYRVVENSLSSNKINAIKRTWNTYRNIEKLSLIKSSYVLCFYVFNAVRKRM